MPPAFPHTEVKNVTQWSNFHGTVTASVPVFATPDVIGASGADAPRRLARHGAAISAILDYCFNENMRLRVMGSRWSLSDIIRPSDVALDPANLNVMLTVKPEWVTAEYRAQRPTHTPVFAQGGTQISSINRRLGQIGLALQTSGASDGHRIAGCIATGSHGSAVSIGAVHDTILAIHLITGPKRSVLLQPTAAACTDDVAEWLEKETGIPTESVRDDAQFAAAQVSLGSLGVVHGVVIDAVPLYRLKQRKLALPFGDKRVWEAMKTLETGPLHPDRKKRPYHFEVVLHPYPSKGSAGAFVVLMWDEPLDGAQFSGPLPNAPDLSTDMIDLISDVSSLLDGAISGIGVKLALNEILGSRYKPGDKKPVFPGEMFGPTSTPPGDGTSIEIVVDHARTQAALEAVFNVLAAEGALGRHLLGAVGTRFVPQTRAWLGMNIHAKNCFIEMPSMKNEEVEGIYRKCLNALETEEIPFTCHWGQFFRDMTAKRVANYFGDRAKQWTAARSLLLPEPAARHVFASPILAQAGLEV